ncbi:MAG: ABC-F type ribosomal protection protein [bacterium]|nr:ABC-F type ribosomal protection protein [bacterium]
MLTIRIRDLSKSYGERTLFEKFSLDIHAGDRIGIVGPNGTGKTTLLKLILNILEPDRGYVEVSGKIGYLPQDLTLPENKLVRECFKIHSSSAILKRMGLRKDILDSPCKVLSGGEKTKLKLAELLEDKPIILILDEPTNHIDIKGIEFLEEELNKFSGTLLIVSHDRFLLDKVTNKIIEIYRGKISLYTGNYSNYAQKKKEELERAWQEYERYTEEKKRLEEASRKIKERAQSVGRIKDKKDSFWRYSKDFYGRKASKVAKIGKSIEKRIERLEAKEKPFEEQHIKLEFDSKDEGLDTIIRCTALSKSFGNKLLFENADLSVKNGQKIALLGNNGAGKTTLLRIILGEESPTKGEVWISKSAKIGYLEQEINLLNLENTIIEEVKRASNSDITTIRTLLGCLLFLEDEVLKPISSLSMGERVRVTLAKLILGGFNILLMDEPTNFLDISSREVIEEALKWYKGSIIFVSHDRYFVSKIADTIWEIENCRITVYPGDYEYYLFKRSRLRDGEIKDKILLLEVQLSKIISELSKEKDENKEDLNRRFIELSSEINRLKSMIK